MAEMADGRGWQMAEDGRWQRMADVADGRWQTWQKTSLGHTSLFLILSLIVFLQVNSVSSSSSSLFSLLSSLLYQQMTRTNKVVWSPSRLTQVSLLSLSLFSSLFSLSSSLFALFSSLSFSLLSLFSTIQQMTQIQQT